MVAWDVARWGVIMIIISANAVECWIDTDVQYGPFVFSLSLSFS